MFGLAFALTVTLATVAASPVTTKLSSQKTAAVAAADDYKNKLVRGAKVIRQLDQDPVGYDEFIDLTGYSLKFEKCQAVKDLSELVDEIVLETTQRNGESDSVLVETQQQFVVFRLCPTSSENCNYNYGEYMIDLRDYLQYTVEYRTQQQVEMCATCYDQCFIPTGDDDAHGDDYYFGDDGEDSERRRLVDVDCPSCQSECDKITNMAENYYVDATNFINCVQFSEATDDTPDLYGGPLCDSEGSKIKIGAFSDDQCKALTNYNVEDYLTDDYGNAMKISHALLKTTYNNKDPISCTAYHGEDDTAQAKNAPVCASLYMESDKCEQYGYSPMQSSSNSYDVDNQVAKEEPVCDFISFLTGNDEEIVNSSATTRWHQKFALSISFILLGTTGILF